MSYSASMSRAKQAARETNNVLNAYDFDPNQWVELYMEDGAKYMVPCSFVKIWVDPDDGKKWLFVFSEHYDTLVQSYDDVIAWNEFLRVNGDLGEGTI